MKEKTYRGEWYTINSLFGNAAWGCLFYVLTGGRGVGKSYAVMKWATERKLKLGDRFKFYWFRLTDEAVKKLLAGGAEKFIDPDLQRKYGIKTFRKGNTVYTYREVDGKKTDIQEFCQILSCSTFYNTKGVGYYDADYDGEYFCVLDEMNKEQSERNTGDVLYQFCNLCENVFRFTKNNIKIVMIGNTLSEVSDISVAFNFIPDKPGRYKLKRKRCVFDVIRSNTAHQERREGSIADILMGDASTFTNEYEIDRSLLVNKRTCIKPSYVLCFGNQDDKKFTVWDGKTIKAFNNEKCVPMAMKRYVDAPFNATFVNDVFLQWDARAFKFTTLSDLKRFQKELKLLRKK